MPAEVTVPHPGPYEAERTIDQQAYALHMETFEPLLDYRKVMETPAWLECPHCHTGNFRIVTDAGDRQSQRGSGTVQIFCENGHRQTPVCQLVLAQMSELIARKTGIYVPS